MSQTLTNGFWQRLLWGLIMPRKSRQKAEVTPSGIVLILASFGIGVAAYNSASNILFITLSLLLGSLILSGILSWVNLRSLELSINISSHARVGEPLLISIVVRNPRRRLSAEALWVELRAEPLDVLLDRPLKGSAIPEIAKTSRENGKQGLLARIKKLDTIIFHGRVPVSGSLSPGEETALVWRWTPPRRGNWVVRAESIGSLYPFGFMRKFRVQPNLLEVKVRPALLDYSSESPLHGGHEGLAGRRLVKGDGPDLLGVRLYQPGDAQRLVHWKASARHGQLMVKESAEEKRESYDLCLPLSRTYWSEAQQFERAVALVATLAEDLFRAGRLRALSLGTAQHTRISTPSDLNACLDRLSCIQLIDADEAESHLAVGVGRLIVLPAGPKEAAAFLHGLGIYNSQSA
jgi:uncharacterized protein (DUF58 family)